VFVLVLMLHVVPVDIGPQAFQTEDRSDDVAVALAASKSKEHVLPRLGALLLCLSEPLGELRVVFPAPKHRLPRDPGFPAGVTDRPTLGDQLEEWLELLKRFDFAHSSD